MNREELVFEQVDGLYRIIPLRVLRKTPGVSFDLVPDEVLPRTNFNVYDLDTVGGEYHTIRAGYLDQPTG